MKLLLTESTLTEIQNYLGKCAETGGKFSIEISKFKKNRSLEQNAKLHALLRVIAEETGNSVADVKEYACAAFLGEITYEFKGQKRTRTRSTSELTTDECADFIERLQALASELGL